MKRKEKTRKAKRSHSQFKNGYNFFLNETKWLSNKKTFFKNQKVTRLWGVREEITFLRNQIERFTFRVQKVSSVFSPVRERDFTDLFLVVSKLSSAQCSRSHNERKISSEFSPATSRRDSQAPRVSILLRLFPVGLRVLVGCLTSPLPPSSCSHVKTIFSSTDWSVRRFVCVQRMDVTHIFCSFPPYPTLTHFR